MNARLRAVSFRRENVSKDSIERAVKAIGSEAGITTRSATRLWPGGVAVIVRP